MKLPSKEFAELKHLRERAYRKQGGRCYWCFCEMIKGAPDGDPKQLTGDHLIPLYAGGKTIAGNIVAACFACNNGRSRETDRGYGGLVVTVGNDRTKSPFDVLKDIVL